MINGKNKAVNFSSRFTLFNSTLYTYIIQYVIRIYQCCFFFARFIVVPLYSNCTVLQSLSFVKAKCKIKVSNIVRTMIVKYLKFCNVFLSNYSLYFGFGKIFLNVYYLSIIGKSLRDYVFDPQKRFPTLDCQVLLI